jgi:hypothetical protein
MGISSQRLRASPESTIDDQTLTVEPAVEIALETTRPARGPAGHAAAVATIDWIIKRWVLTSPRDTGQNGRILDDTEAGLSTFEFSRQEIAFIDAKASAVLTHVSVMVATAGILMSYVAQSALERTIMVSELALYLLIAVLCIRCIMHPPNWQADLSHPEVLREINGEVLYLRRLVYFCSAFTVTVTMILMVTVPILAYF